MIYLPLAVLPGLLLAPLGCWPKGKAAIDKVALLWGGKPNSAKARSSEELKFLSSQATLSYRVAVATDAFIAFPCGQRPKGCFSLRPANFVSASEKKLKTSFNFVESPPLSIEKKQAILYIRSLRFGFSLALTLFSSFSLAERVQASLILARSCVSCTIFTALPCIFNLLRSLKIGGGSEKLKTSFGFSLALHYFCRRYGAITCITADLHAFADGAHRIYRIG